MFKDETLLPHRDHDERGCRVLHEPRPLCKALRADKIENCHVVLNRSRRLSQLAHVSIHKNSETPYTVS